MNEKLDFIFKRRSVRKYTEEPVDTATIKDLLEAAMAAPSANDLRPWAFVVVQDAKKRRELGAVQPWSGMCAKAPLVFAVLGDPAVSEHWVEDCSAATENILLAVTALDLGAVWVAIYPHEEREKQVHSILAIPNNYRILCLIAVGHPVEQKKPRTRYEEKKVYFENKPPTFSKLFSE